MISDRGGVERNGGYRLTESQSDTPSADVGAGVSLVWEACVSVDGTVWIKHIHGLFDGTSFDGGGGCLLWTVERSERVAQRSKNEFDRWPYHLQSYLNLKLLSGRPSKPDS